MYTYSYFKKSMENDKSVANHETSKNLCLLFGASSVLKNISPIIEGGFIKPEQISALSRLK